jgi:hypothetical protein
MDKLVPYIVNEYYVENPYKNCSFLRAKRTDSISARCAKSERCK